MGEDSWMVTYSDMVTLLLTFFVMLISMASFEQETFKKKFYVISQSFLSQQGIGIFKRGGTGKIVVISRKKIIEELRRGLPKEILARLTQKIEVIPRKDGWVLRLPDKLLFKPNSTKLSPNAYPILDEIALLLRKILADVIIKGYADSSEWDPWTLSAARAEAVLDYFVKVKKIDENRFVLKAYGDTKPLVTSGDLTARGKNRRVEIFIKKKKFVLNFGRR